MPSPISPGRSTQDLRPPCWSAPASIAQATRHGSRRSPRRRWPTFQRPPIGSWRSGRRDPTRGTSTVPAGANVGDVLEQPAQQIDDQKQDDRAESRGHDRADETSTEGEAQAEPREQQGCDKGAGDTHKNVAEKTEAPTRDHDAGEPTGNGADQERDDDTHDIHDFPPFSVPCVGRSGTAGAYRIALGATSRLKRRAPCVRLSRECDGRGRSA